MGVVRRAIVKLGGGLITDKTRHGVVRGPVIRQLGEALLELQRSGWSVIIVHGAGGFGHLKARAWRLAEGRVEGWRGAQAQVAAGRGLTGWQPEPEADQHAGVAEVRADMLDLAGHVSEHLHVAGLAVVRLPTHAWARGTDPAFTGELQPFVRPAAAPVPVCWGDVVDVDGPAGFGILSGDDIAHRLATELPDVEALVFCVDGVPGLLRRPPSAETPSEPIARWWPGLEYEGHHDTAIDVTGGIGLKAARGAAAGTRVSRVWIIDGLHPERLLAAARGERPVGTELFATPPGDAPV